MRRKRTEQLNTRVEGWMKKRLIEIAERDEVTVADVVNVLFRECLHEGFTVHGELEQDNTPEDYEDEDGSDVSIFEDDPPEQPKHRKNRNGDPIVSRSIERFSKSRYK